MTMLKTTSLYANVEIKARTETTNRACCLFTTAFYFGQDMAGEFSTHLQFFNEKAIGKERVHGCPRSHGKHSETTRL